VATEGTQAVSDVRACRHCHEVRNLADLLEVVNLRSGLSSYVCRPNICFCFSRSVKNAATERIQTPKGDAA
jgi:hypothetical protein